MTEQTVPAILDSILEPLASILVKLNRALHVAKASHLSAPYIDTISDSKDALDTSWEAFQQIVTSLEPDRYKHELLERQTTNNHGPTPFTPPEEPAND